MTLALARLDLRADRVRALIPWAVLAAVGAAVFAGLCDAVGDHDGITAVDLPVATWFAAHRGLAEGQLGLLLARATSPAVLLTLVAVVAVVLHRRGRVRAAFTLVSGTVLAYGVGAAAKIGEHRGRPGSPLNLAPETEPSFPSGHVLVVTTVALIALALAWSHLSRRGRVLASLGAVVVIATISLDRLVVGAHWLTDVVGSLALSAVVVSVVLAASTVTAPTAGRA